MILIYRDRGVSEQSAIGWHHFLTGCLPKKVDVRWVNGLAVQEGSCFNQANLFILPGGRSLPFYEDMGVKGNANLCQFVTRGGHFLGVCAGAYYAATQTVFAQGLPLEVIKQGGVNFFKGKAVGPVFTPSTFAYRSEQGARIVKLTWVDGHQYSVYWNGGCTFEADDIGWKSFSVLGQYLELADQPPAIIAGQYGNGRVLLSGVHPELCEQTIPRDGHAHHDELRALLKEYKSERLQLMKALIDYIG